MHHSTIPETAAEKKHPKVWLSLKIILPFVVIAVGALVMIGMVKTAPSAERKPPVRTARLVEVETVSRSNARALISAMGRVSPAREVMLHPQVSGTVIEISPELIPGGIKQAGDMLLKIDPADYEIRLRQAESERIAAQGALTQEMGQQAIARKEFELLGGAELSPEERALILREPQLAAAQARLASAEAALEQAKLNLARTTVTAPFHAVIRERHVDIGAQVSPSTPLAMLTSADAYWITAMVPVGQLTWLNIPAAAGDEGSLARVMTGDGAHREGRVLRRLTDLEENGRMAQVLIEVTDPLGNGDTSSPAPLLIGDFVRVEIEGLELENVVELDRHRLRAHHETWVMNENDELEMRELDIAFRGEHSVLVRSGLEEGERVVVTDLAAPVAGMKLTTGSGTSGERP
jgi:RND family efflux transporter MFP subunit